MKLNFGFEQFKNWYNQLKQVSKKLILCVCYWVKIIFIGKWKIILLKKLKNWL